MKLLGIISVGFDLTDQAFYLYDTGEKMGVQ
jgi:hypothetical protein